MFIKISSVFPSKKHNNLSKNKISKKPIIIIPKKNVKLANKRNKIRRQIRAILQQSRCFKERIIVKYLEKNFKPDFQELKQEILSGILKFETKN